MTIDTIGVRTRLPSRYRPKADAALLSARQ